MPEGHTKIGSIPQNNNDAPNKLIISVLNLERETVMGIGRSFRSNISSDKIIGSYPPWHFNIDFILAAVFEEKQYEQSLKKLSLAIECLQQHQTFQLSTDNYFTIETVNQNIQELTNIWSMFGSKYYPSIVLKIRMITFNGNEFQSVSYKINQPDVESYKK